MNRILIATLISLASVAAVAQLQAPKRIPMAVKNPDMVMETRGAKIEIYPERRVSIIKSTAGQTAMREVTDGGAAATISARAPALVFNHAYQQYGYATGEIAFKFKAFAPTDVSAAVGSTARKVGTLDMYVVNAKTPAELVSLTEKLQTRADIQWVVPTVTYVPLLEAGRQ